MSDWHDDHFGEYKTYNKKLLNEYLASMYDFERFLGYHDAQAFLQDEEKLVFVPPFRLNPIQQIALDSVIYTLNQLRMKENPHPCIAWRKLFYDAMFFAFYETRKCLFFSLKNEKCPAGCKTKEELKKCVLTILSKRLVLSSTQDKLAMNGMISKRDLALVIGSICAYVTYRSCEMMIKLQTFGLPTDAQDKIIDEIAHPSYRLYMDIVCDLIMR